MAEKSPGRYGGQKLTQIDDLFFFTHLKKKFVNGCRVARTVGPSGGKWLGKNLAKPM
uniref:Uncharacterized protein n=1 Tax=Rhizophora mucronata TaxID=61149 RepID=A0A2P2NMG3_RHIMU